MRFLLILNLLFIQPILCQNNEIRSTIVVTMQEDTTNTLNSITRSYKARRSKLKIMRDSLEAHARRSQMNVIRYLTQNGASFSRSESIWITNQIVVYNATTLLMDRLRRFKGVAEVDYEKVFPLLDDVEYTGSTAAAESTTATYGTAVTSGPNWNIAKIGTQSMWDAGYNGTGVVVGTIDTGVRASHDVLRSNFRSTYNWYDPEKKLKIPYDTTGHGTHVIGILAGSNGIGVAPGVSWITCKGCRASGCVVSELIACFQFMLCPTRFDGSGKDCSKAPDIVSNSWGAGQGLTTFNSVISSLRTAGIIPVFASGNTGPQCGTVVSPGDATNVIAVGATDNSDMLSSYSSVGPSIKNVTKPDFVAPGSEITSSCYTSDQDLCVKSGTSMATPHVSGLIALYLNQFPSASYASVRTYFERNAERGTLQPTDYTCGSSLSIFPNNMYGYGRIRLTVS